MNIFFHSISNSTERGGIATSHSFNKIFVQKNRSLSNYKRRCGICASVILCLSTIERKVMCFISIRVINWRHQFETCLIFSNNLWRTSCVLKRVVLLKMVSSILVRLTFNFAILRILSSLRAGVHFVYIDRISMLLNFGGNSLFLGSQTYANMFCPKPNASD